jgi:hypothetical protein
VLATLQLQKIKKGFFEFFVSDRIKTFAVLLRLTQQDKTKKIFLPAKKLASFFSRTWFCKKLIETTFFSLLTLVK